MTVMAPITHGLDAIPTHLNPVDCLLAPVPKRHPLAQGCLARANSNEGT